MATQHTTATGRIVWAAGGHPCKGEPKIDEKTKQPVLRDGQPVTRWTFGLAIPKADFGPTWQVMQAEAMKHYPAGVFPTDYAWKYVDCDAMDKGQPDKGIPPKRYGEREGYEGCYVLTCSTEWAAPPVFKWGGNGWNQIDHSEIKIGDFVQVGLTIDAHLGQSPGLYINPNGIQFVGYGEPIIKGADPNTMFGAGPAALPPGASATPQAPSGVPGAPMPGNAAPAAVPTPGNPAPQAPATAAPAPTASPSSPPAPVPGFAQGTPQLPGQPAPATPAAPPAPPAPAPAPAAPQREQAGIDANGTPYYWNADRTATEY